MTISMEPAPTKRQLQYLRILAARSATTFAYPATQAQASRQIDRLRKLEREPRSSSRHLDELDCEHLRYATAVDDSEVSGYGASATWRAGSRAARYPALPKVAGGKVTELARYRLSTGERVLNGKLIDHRVSVTDRPAHGDGRSYLVESDVAPDEHTALEALIADYVQQARELDDIPMSASAIRRRLDEVSTGA